MNMLRVYCCKNKKNAAVWMLAGLLVLSAGAARAVEFVTISIYPEHVGVFTTLGKQQFVAYGIDEHFGRYNITEQVNWVSSDENLVTIDESGMATVRPGITSGQVKISCIYPKTGGGSGGNDIGPAVNVLLLDSSSQ